MIRIWPRVVDRDTTERLEAEQRVMSDRQVPADQIHVSRGWLIVLVDRPGIRNLLDVYRKARVVNVDDRDPLRREDTRHIGDMTIRVDRHR